MNCVVVVSDGQVWQAPVEEGRRIEGPGWSVEVFWHPGEEGHASLWEVAFRREPFHQKRSLILLPDQVMVGWRVGGTDIGVIPCQPSGLEGFSET